MPMVDEAPLIVTRVRTRETLELARPLLERAVAKVFPDAGPSSFLGFLAGHVADPGIGLFVAFRHRVARGVAIGILPNSPFMLTGQVILAFSDRPETARRLGERMNQWFRDHRCLEVLAVHRGNAPAFMRATRHFGVPSVWGTMIAYRLES